MTGLWAAPAAGSARAAAASVVDPEIRVLTIDELGILRDVSVDASTGRVTVVITAPGPCRCDSPCAARWRFGTLFAAPLLCFTPGYTCCPISGQRVLPTLKQSKGGGAGTRRRAPTPPVGPQRVRR